MKLTIRSEHHAMALAQFCKRVTYEDAYRRAHGETEEERKAMAYRILGALGDVENALNDAGISPR